MAFRIFIVITVFTLLYGALGANLYRFQIAKSDYYIARANARTLSVQKDSPRGNIFITDKNNSSFALAQNRDVPSIFASPKEIKNPSDAAKTLTSLLGLDEASLLQAFGNTKSAYKELINKPTQEQITKVDELSLKGIYVGKNSVRTYPSGELAAGVLGYVGKNEKNPNPTGLYGIEKLENETLANGNDINLTIDRNLQTQSEIILKKLVETYGAVGGTVIIQEPKTGKILALANNPTFNPNPDEYAKYPIKNFINNAVQSVYEPGSVFKPLTMAAGIDTGAFTPETTFYDSGSITLNGKKITNWDHKAHGTVTMTNVIEDSINTGAIFAEQKEGNATFYKYLKQFGFGDLTHVDLPDEVPGSLKNLERKGARAVDYANASFGQGTAVNSLQLITAFSSIANGGVLMRPFVNAKEKPEMVRRVIKADTAQKVTAMMESAVEKAQVAAIPHYHVAGKTGTAQIPDFVHGGYTDQYIHSYVGFAPATDPRFTILLKLERPNVTLAGQTVVPAFQTLASYILNYYNIPPDNLPANAQ